MRGVVAVKKLAIKIKLVHFLLAIK